MCIHFKDAKLITKAKDQIIKVSFEVFNRLLICHHYQTGSSQKQKQSILNYLTLSDKEKKRFRFYDTNLLLAFKI